MDRVDGDDPAGAGARLARQSEGALDDQCGRRVEVGVVEDDDGVLAAHLQLYAPVGADAAVDGASDLGGPGEGHRGDPLVAGPAAPALPSPWTSAIAPAGRPPASRASTSR